jgi:hypothetical protein
MPGFAGAPPNRPPPFDRDVPPAPPQIRRAPRPQPRPPDPAGQYEPIKGAAAVSFVVPPGFSLPVVSAPDNEQLEKAVLAQFDIVALLRNLAQP